ncbi:hypothetical protein [Flavivirga sp. 57AJ16]|uniref:hypothetical protein n=1 Tax=Flavivirga sp. 57AJ16 TaxID=3025307 RepID=UPI002365FED7|nr:hypothetical protein [Flavivirga sp. 57AJ16]MDD7885846.1 hypothetical protein [Flavivirga sp. 57AJ16]
MKNNNNFFSVLIPYGEQPLLTDAMNCFSQTSSAKMFTMLNDKNVEIRYSRYVHAFFNYSKTDNKKGWISNINKGLAFNFSKRKIKTFAVQKEETLILNK